MSRKCVVFFMALVLVSIWIGGSVASNGFDTTAPDSPVKLIFIHHSTGGNWLADPNSDQPYGGLGSALMNNNYYVSATNYGWGPDSIGDRTDIPNWPEWFTGSNSSSILSSLYTENGQNIGDFGAWSRLASDPGGENEIIMFKSCFPNSDLFGNPTDPPASEANDQYTVSNAKAVYNNLLTYFQTCQDKLFIVITAPPQNENAYSPDIHTPAERAANARAFNNWLVNDWLDGYTYNNVAVFDYYNVLTAADNHHRWYNGTIQHVVNTNYNFSAYPSDEWDSHPSTTGHQKATSEFIDLLNIYYHSWHGTGPSPEAPTTTTDSATSVTSTSATLNGTVNPNGLSTTYYFQYGTTDSYGSTTSEANAGSGTSDLSVNAGISGLVANTTYHFRLVAINSAGTTYGSDRTLTTLVTETGNMVTSDLWIRAVINTEEKGSIEAVWLKGGEDTTSRGDTVIWGHFYASPSDVTWGSENNPDLYVKIWFDVSGRIDVNYFHVSVPDIEVYSDYPYDGTADEQGTTTMSRRYIRQYYENGESHMDENYEDGVPPGGYSPSGNPSGYSTINDLKIGSIINTVEKGPIDAVWRLGGQDTTARGDQVVWGLFYANPSDVTWGSEDNPDLFVKIWFDVSGRVDVNFFHVSVPDIEVYSDLPDEGAYDQQGTTIMADRYIRHEYWISESNGTGQLVQPGDFQYVGAFRLPGDDERPATFAYGGNAMTLNPDGDPSSAADGFPGSLFVTGHDRMPYGELPNGDQVAEISIPEPIISKNLTDLNQAAFLQTFQAAAQGLFDAYAELPRIGMQYLSTTATGAKIHLCWGQHFHEDALEQIPTHAWIDPNLSVPNPQGTWYIGNQSLYSVNGYMFEIPASWADTNAAGRYLATGRYRDGGWSGQGPSLFAYTPWIDSSGTPASPGTRLEEAVLLLYENSRDSDDVVSRTLSGYQHADEWEGGAWITTTTGKSAVLFAGTKGTGAKYWYGWTNPAGPDLPCVDTALVSEMTTCRLADGSACPPEDLTGCEGHPDSRGWWSSRFDAQFILYDPADLAQVASGATEPWEPQPYASVDIDEHLLLNPAGIEEDFLGTGLQRRYRIGAVSYHRSSNLIYVLELFADEAKPIVHVWRVN